MQLTGYESVATGIIGTPNASNTQSASYDLSADRVIINGQTQQLPFSLRPQHMCVIVSKERLKVPRDFVGYALPKTRLCQRGLLTLNTGILDPGYDGLISTTAINFRSEPIQIRPNEPFLRIVIHELKSFTNAPTPKAQSFPDAEYIEARETESADYPATFLDIPSSFESVAHRVREQVFSQLGITLTIVVGILALGFTVANLVFTHFQGKNAVKEVRDIAVSARQVTGLKARVDEMTNSIHVSNGKIDELERNLTRLDVATKDLENRVQSTGRRR